MTFDEYVELVQKRQQEYPEWRIGQTYFNVLYEVCPGLADSIRGTALDPFYEGKFFDVPVLTKFLEHVYNEWENITWPS